MEKGLNLREAMPNVARLVDEQRVLHGAAYVNGIVKRALAGTPDLFYAFENGYVLGTPFKADAITARLLELGVALGAKHAMVMKPPKAEVPHGT